MKCEVCSAENDLAARFCVSCGIALGQHCRRCKSPIPAGAQFCPACGHSLTVAQVSPSAREASRRPTAERKRLTVLFADLIGFTTLGEKLDPEELHELMNDIWMRLDAIITSHGGIIDKHIGDAVMALFGAEQAREEDPEMAIKAGLAMESCLNKLRLGDAFPRLQMRVGIHTGPVLLGFIGTTREFTATGDTVNLASRLQTQAPVGGLLISHDTFRQVCGLFDVQMLEAFEIRGKEEPVQVYQVLRAKPRPLALRARGVEGVERRMIGREKELKRLQLAVQELSVDGEPRMVTVVGEAGLGKSCLVQEFQKWVEVLPKNFRLFSGRATAETTALPFSLIRDVFCNRLRIQETDLPETARRKFEDGMLSLAGASAVSDAGKRIQNHAHFVGQLLGLDFSSSPHLASVLHDPEQIRHRAFRYMARFFASVSRASRLPGETSVTQAAVLLLEDVHWADDGSLDFVEYLARSCRAPLLIICIGRSSLLERRPAWGKSLPAHALIELKPLSSAKSRLLVETLLRKADAVPEDLLQLIALGGEGNPFYIEEIINMLIDEKVFRPGPDRWRVDPTRLTPSSIPPTLTGVLQARLDGLSAMERAVMQRAAVVGRVFWDSALMFLTGKNGATETKDGADTTLIKAQLPELLGALQRKELILRHDTSAFAGATEYCFKHELLRSATYDTVLMKARREYHARAGDWFVSQGGARVLEFAGLVASHFEKGNHPSEAAEWYGRAGQQARLRYEPEAAIRLFQKALGLLSPELPTSQSLRLRLEWLEGLSEVLGAQARFGEALEAARGAGKLAARLGDGLAQVRVMNTVAFLQERMGSNAESIQTAEEAGRMAEQLGEQEGACAERIRALYLKGWALYRLGDSSTVLELAEETRKLCAASGERRALVTSLKLNGVAQLQLGNFSQAEAYFREGLELARELGDRRNTAAMLSNLGETARLRGNSRAAAKLYHRAVSLARAIGHRESELIYLSNLAGARLGLGEFAQAEADLRHSIALASQDNTCSLAETYSFLSQACCEQGKFKDAWEAAEHALRLARHSGNFLDIGGAWCALARATAGRQRAREKDLPAAAATDPRAYFEESARVYHHIGAESDRARTLQAWGIYELEQGKLVESRRLMSEARRIFVQLGVAGELTEE